MKIGIDMDNTICSTIEKINEYQKKYIEKEKITLEELWNTKEHKEKFLKKYLERIYNEAKLKENANSTINKLKECGYKIYIITARSEKYVSNIYNIINNYCTKNNFTIDGIFIDAKDKADICKKNKINIMIEYNKYNFDKLTDNNIKTILYDENNTYNEIDNRINSWNEYTKIIDIINN